MIYDDDDDDDDDDDSYFDYSSFVEFILQCQGRYVEP